MNTPNTIEQDFGEDHDSLIQRESELIDEGYALQCTIGDNEAGRAYVESEKSNLEGHAVTILKVRGLIYLLAKNCEATTSEVA